MGRPDSAAMLYVVATPIGNLDDISARALEVLRNVDLIAAEDTRRTRCLLSHFEIPAGARLMSYREHREEAAGRKIAACLEQGGRVALCSDSGTPGISDPGYRLIQLALEREFSIEAIPGASAVHVALLLSGLATSSYTFKGFPPRKEGPRCRFFEEDAGQPHTLIVFESPYRVGATLKSALSVLGDRRAAVCSELTKKFERTARGYLGDLSEQFASAPVKGEVTIVIAGNNPKFAR